MKELMVKLDERHTTKKPNFKTKVVQGDLSDQVNAIANDLDTGAIVMETIGTSGIKEVLIGPDAVS